MEITEEYGLVACFHPHLGSIAEKPEEIDALFAASDIKICPDLAHLKAGGYDPLTFIKKYYDRIAFIHLKDLHDNGTPDSESTAPDMYHAHPMASISLKRPLCPSFFLY